MTFSEIGIIILILIIIALFAYIIINNKKNNSSQNEELSNEILYLKSALDKMKADEEQKTRETRSEIREIGNSISMNVGKQMQMLNLQVNQMSQSNEERMDRLRNSLGQEMQEFREQNEKSVENIRSTVSEKLEGTLENKIGESFKQVSERLEQVYKGLGEMQNLASNVGDLQRLLSNVKTRGIWGEVQLGSILEEILTKDQYAENVAVKSGSTERVEYAIILPGKQEGKPVYLPIDAKFPVEDYIRLTNAEEAGDLEQINLAGKALEQSIKNCANMISTKYIAPPETTDFAIMFLPIEGLYAEVLQRDGLYEKIQREYRVTIAGPTTLSAMVNSLQMGFRTLAIEKQASEVWMVLSAVKTEFAKFDEVLDKTKKKLEEADNVVEKAQTRSRVIQRKLKEVEEISEEEANKILD